MVLCSCINHHMIVAIGCYTMATSSQLSTAPAHKDVLSKLDSQLTCAICLDRYTEPRTLPCLHSYCKECIDQLPKVGYERRHVVKCPSCREPTRLGERGASALPAAFHINNLLEIDALLKKVSVSDVVPLCHAHNDRPKDLYCETCETHVCFKCSTDSHHKHQCDRPEYLFTKHQQQIQACLQPLKQQIHEVEQTLTRYDTMEKEMRNQEEAVQNKIDAAYQQLIDQLQESRRNLSRQASSELQEKLKLHLLPKTNVETILLKLKSCNEFVEEELKSRSQYQIQEAKKQLVKHISKTHSEVKTNELQPAQKPMVFKPSTTEHSHIGTITCKQIFPPLPGLFTVDIPDGLVREDTEVVLTALSAVPSAKRLHCKLEFNSTFQNMFFGNSAHPITCIEEEEGQFIITIEPRFAGCRELHIAIDGVEIYGSPFSVHTYSAYNPYRSKMLSKDNSSLIFITIDNFMRAAFK